MSADSGFFSDPKVMISLLALLVSIVAVVWSLANQWDQNRRWKSINAANIVLRETKMLPWERIGGTEAKSRNWGYLPEIFGGDLKDEFLLLSAIKLRDASRNMPINGAAMFSTSQEAAAEAKRLGLSKHVSLTKTLRPFFQFENIGKTIAYKTNITIDVMEAVSPEKKWRRAFEANSRPDVGPGQQTSSYVDIGLPSDMKVEKLSFRINVEFEDLDKVKKSSEIMLSWDGMANYWHYSPGKSNEER